jgi:hypothetical protein
MTLAEMDALWDERKRLERAEETASVDLSFHKDA